MTVGELLEALEGLDPETPVVAAIQPSYPLRVTVDGVHTPSEGEISDDEYDAIQEANGGELTPEQVQEVWEQDNEVREVTIITGGAPYEGSPYASRNLWARSAF